MMNSLLLQLKPWIAWMHLHPYALSGATFFIAFIECLAVVGLLVPGTVIMTAIGALVGSGVVSAEMVFIPAILGAILGDILSFLLGAHYREHLRELWPFKFYPRILQKGETFFYRHGGTGIFVGRFLGPIRPVLPIIAGMLNMPRWRFFIADGVSAIFWAPLYMLPGIILGKASIALAPDVALHLMLYVILILLVLWCISWLIKRLVAWIFSTFHSILDKLWLVIKHKPFLQPLHFALQDPLHPESHAQLTLGLYFILFTGLLGWMVWDVIHFGLLTDWNRPLLFFLRSLRSPSPDHIFLIFTIMGEPKVILGLFAVLLVWFLGVRAFRTAIHWTLLSLLAFGGVELIKLWVHSPRPWGLWMMPTGYSFPSGHTALSAVFTGFLAVLISREVKSSRRWIPYTVASVMVFAIAISRLYLGAHWLTDIVGAMLFAMALVMFITLSYRRNATPKLKVFPLCVVIFLSWMTIAGLYGWKYYAHLATGYQVSVSGKILSMNEWWEYDGIDEPLYRLNRTGKPAQILNVQWAGSINDIKTSLMLHGWHVAPNTIFDAILERINKSPKTPKKVELPVLPPLYLEQHPVLVMTKNLEDSDRLLLLSLWNSKTQFTNISLPLWLGNVTYIYSWQTGFFHLHPQKVNLPAIPAIKILESDLDNYEWKQLSYPFSPHNSFAKLEWDGQMILVKPKHVESE